MLGWHSGAVSQPCCYSPSSFQVLILNLKNLMARLLMRSINFYVVQIFPVSNRFESGFQGSSACSEIDLRQTPSFLCSSNMNKNIKKTFLGRCHNWPVSKTVAQFKHLHLYPNLHTLLPHPECKSVSKNFDQCGSLTLLQGGGGAKSDHSEKAWPSVNHLIISEIKGVYFFQPP